VNPTSPAPPNAAAANSDNVNANTTDNSNGDVDWDNSDDEVDWEDEDDDEDRCEYGLPKLDGEDVCVVVDKSGVHRIRVRPCICPGHSPLDLQYLDMRLFPASLRRIKTAFTFAVLDDFRMDNLECKTAGLNYYNKLRRITSNEFPRSVPVYFLRADENNALNSSIFSQDRYREMLRVSQLWRNLKYRKWHGFGHAFNPEPGPGGLALFCAACPQPGVNLPDGWRDDPDQSVSLDGTYMQDNKCFTDDGGTDGNLLEPTHLTATSQRSS
jgi:hypothetical protein